MISSEELLHLHCDSWPRWLGKLQLWSVRIPVVICHVVRIPVLVESTLAKFLFGFGFVPNHFSRLLVLLKLWYHCPSSQRYQIPFLALSTNQSGGSLRVEVDNLRVQEPAGIRGNIKFFGRTVFSAIENTQIPNLSFKFSSFPLSPERWCYKCWEILRQSWDPPAGGVSIKLRWKKHFDN